MLYILSQTENKILTHATTWINLDDIMLSEISQKQKDKYYVIVLYELPGTGKFIETESRTEATRG